MTGQTQFVDYIFRTLKLVEIKSENKTSNNNSIPGLKGRRVIATRKIFVGIKCVDSNQVYVQTVVFLYIHFIIIVIIQQ